MTPNDFCFVVLNYRRPWNIPTIANAALDYGFGDVIIWDNSEDPPTLEDWLRRGANEGVRAYSVGTPNDGNMFTMGRYYAVQEMSDRALIATCDDDYLVTRIGWDRMIREWDGESIAAQLPTENNQFEAAKGLPFINLGYGSLFRLDWAYEAFHAIDRATESRHQDLIFRKADRCFTTYHHQRQLFNAQFGMDLIRMRNPDGRYSETDRHAIHMRGSHIKESYQAVSYALQAKSEAVA